MRGVTLLACVCLVMAERRQSQACAMLTRMCLHLFFPEGSTLGGGESFQEENLSRRRIFPGWRTFPEGSVLPLPWLHPPPSGAHVKGV